jgi:hypothetical protein
MNSSQLQAFVENLQRWVPELKLGSVICEWMITDTFWCFASARSHGHLKRSGRSDQKMESNGNSPSPRTHGRGGNVSVVGLWSSLLSLCHVVNAIIRVNMSSVFPQHSQGSPREANVVHWQWQLPLRLLSLSGISTTHIQTPYSGRACARTTMSWLFCHTMMSSCRQSSSGLQMKLPVPVQDITPVALEKFLKL